MPHSTQTVSNGAREKLTASRKAAWAAGAVTDVIMSNAFSYLALPIYNIALHVDPRIIGWAMGLPRCWEIVTDPLIGNLSDNTRTRWGRRRPFIFVGALLCGLIFALAWMPPTSLSPRAIGIYLFVIAIAYYTAYGIFAIPWGAMGLELSTDYHERTGIQAYKTFVQAIGGLFLGTFWWLAFQFGSGNEVKGVRWVGILFGLLTAFAGLIATFSGTEQIAGRRQEKISFLAATRATFSDSTFLVLTGVVLLTLIGLFLIQPLAMYINIHYVFGGNREPVSSLNMMLNFVFQGAGLALTPVVAYASRWFGKKATLCGGLLLVAIGYLTSWRCYTPAHPYLQIITLGLCAPGLSCLWVISPSMLADVCDLDEAKTGLRREGMYYATFTWVTKVGMAVALILSGYLLQVAGYRSEVSAQPAEVIVHLRLLYMIVPVLFTAAALALVVVYPLSEKRAKEIRESLETRRGAT